MAVVRTVFTIVRQAGFLAMMSAQITGAEYFHAGNANDLKKVYEKLNAQFKLERGETEVSALLTALAALLLAAAAALSLLWFHRTL